MDKTLSQAEVDALLNAVRSGGTSPEELGEATATTVRAQASEVKVVSYNFRKPNLISNDQLRGFQLMHDTFGKGVQAAMLAGFKIPLEVKPIALDNLTYGEFVMSVMSPSFIVVLGTTPNMGDLVIDFNLPIILSAIEVMLGGDGAGNPEPRELTTIEQSIASGILEVLLTELHNAWASTLDIKFTVREIESNPENVHATTAEAPVLSAAFDLKMRDITGAMNICYPFELIQPILPRITARMSGRRERASSGDKERKDMMKAIGGVPLDLHVELGSAPVTASQLGSLKLGDVIRLNKRTDSPVEIYVGDRHAYMGELGKRHGNVAVRLLKRHTENGEAESPAAPRAAAKT